MLRHHRLLDELPVVAVNPRLDLLAAGHPTEELEEPIKLFKQLTKTNHFFTIVTL